MELELSEEQTMIRDLAREFAEKEVRPIAEAIDREARFPRETVTRMGELGLLGIAVPEALGGSGGDTVAYVLALEEIARACASHAVIMSVNNSLYCDPVLKYGTPEQKVRFLAPFASGQKIGCFALTEPEAGSDASNQSTLAVRDGEGYVLDGRKVFVTNGRESAAVLVFAQTDRAAGHRGISAFMIEKGTPGFTVVKTEDKLGIRASDTAELLFERCRVPAANRLGEAGQGFRIALGTLDGGRIGIAAQALGIAQAALEAAVKYAGEREQFDRKIGEFDDIREMLANSAIEVDTARLLVYQSAWLRDQGRPHIKEASLGKWHASEAASRCANWAIQVHGGYGYMCEYLVERYLRDAKICEIYEGTSEVQKMVVAAQVLKEHPITS